MSRITRKHKSPCSGKAFAERMAAARAAKARKGSKPAPKASRASKARVGGGDSVPGSSKGVRYVKANTQAFSLDPVPLGRVDVLTIKKGDSAFMHVFKGESPRIYEVAGREGVLVLVGKFRVDAKGMIHDSV